MNTPHAVSRVSAALVLVLSVGCSRGSASSASVGGTDFPARLSGSTTDGAIAEENLNASIAGQLGIAEGRSGDAPSIPTAQIALIDFLGARAQYFGHLQDYDRVEQLAQSLVARRPRDPQAFLARASVFASLHKFPEALADLQKAEDLGAREQRTASLRASVLQATGRLNEAIALRDQVASHSSDPIAIGAAAAARGTGGDIEAAEQGFRRAGALYRDTSPLPAAWLEFQSALLWEKAGQLDKARARYQAAVERLPHFAQAVSHLAGLEALRGNTPRAVELLRALVQRSDDPEYRGQLATLLPPGAEADALRADAQQRYLTLLSRHPEAFADHAARFFLPFDPKEALAQAQVNLRVRQTPEADELALTAALAARDTPAGCSLAEQAQGRSGTSPRIQALAARALSSCSSATQPRAGRPR